MDRGIAIFLALSIGFALAIAPTAAADATGGSGDDEVCTPDGAVCVKHPPLDGTCDSPGCIPGGPGFE